MEKRESIKTSHRNIILLVIGVICLGVLTTALTINNQGTFQNGDKTYVRTADVVVCRGTSLLSDAYNTIACDVNCASTDSDCGDDITNAIGLSNAHVIIRSGIYPVSTTIQLNKSKYLIEGEGFNTRLNASVSNYMVINVSNTQSYMRDFRITGNNQTRTIGINYDTNIIPSVEFGGTNLEFDGVGDTGIKVSGNNEITTGSFNNLFIVGYTTSFNNSVAGKYSFNNLVTEYGTTGFYDRSGVIFIVNHWCEQVTTCLDLVGPAYVVALNTKYSTVTNQVSRTGYLGYNPKIIRIDVENEIFETIGNVNFTSYLPH